MYRTSKIESLTESFMEDLTRDLQPPDVNDSRWSLNDHWEDQESDKILISEMFSLSLELFQRVLKLFGNAVKMFEKFAAIFADSHCEFHRHRSLQPQKTKSSDVLNRTDNCAKSRVAKLVASHKSFVKF